MTRSGAHVVTALDAASAGHSMQAEIERLREETDRRFGPFVLDRINPGHRERDRHRIPLPPSLLAEPAGVELLRFSLPREIGGEGRDKFEWGVVVERLAYLARDHAFSVLFDVYVEVAELILSSSAPAIVDRYLPGLVSGELTAVQAAFESLDPWDWTTTARRTDDGWLVSGTKRFIAGATFADLIVTYVRDEDTGDILAFVIERDDPGVHLTGLETTGLRSIGFGQMMLTDVRLDEEERLMWRSDALSELNTYARNGRLMGACGFVGATEATFDRCVERLGTRFRGGRPIVDYPNVERDLGDMKVAIETAKSMLYRALDAIRGERDPYFDVLATAAKHYAFDAAMKVGGHVMNLHGGEAYMSANPWERFVRDMMSGFGGQGAQELLLIQLGQRIVHGTDLRRVQEEAAERQLAKLCDAWAAMAVAGAASGSRSDADQPLAAAMRDVLAAAGVASGETPDGDAARAIVETGAAIVEEARGGRLTARLAELEDRAASVAGSLAATARRCASFAALAAALESGVLDDLLSGRTRHEIAERLGAPDELVAELLDRLAEASLVRRVEDEWAIAGGLEWLATGGPRRSRFEHEVRAAFALGLTVREHGDRDDDPVEAGGAAALLCDHFLDRLVPQLVGLEDRLCAPGARVLAGSEELAAELARRLPRAAISALADAAPGSGGSAEFAFAWLPDATRGLSTAAPLLADGAWVVMPAARRGDTLAEAVEGLRRVLRGGRDIRAAELEALLAEHGFAGVMALPGPAGARTDLVAARKLSRPASRAGGA